MKAATKYGIRTVLYFPFQLVIGVVISPFLAIAFAMAKADSIAFEDTYMTEDNPMVNQDGPTMQAKRKHWWLTRFIVPWL